MEKLPESSPLPVAAHMQKSADSGADAPRLFDRFVGRDPASGGIHRRDIAVLICYFLLILAYFGPLASADRIPGAPGDNDIVVEWLWKRTYLGEALREGRMPLLNPHIMSEMPFLASSQSAVFYPFNWLFALFPAVWVLNGQIMIHFWAGLAAMHVLMRRMGRSTSAAVLASLVFGFSGFAVQHWWLGHLPFILQWPWTPLAVLAWAALQERAQQAGLPLAGYLRPVLGLAAVLALQFYVGHPQLSYYTILLLALLQLSWIIWTGFQQQGSGAAFRGSVWLVAAGALTAGLVAVQALPVLAFVPGSVREGGLPLKEALIHSVPHSHALLWFTPWAFGGGPGLPYLRSPLGVRDYHEVLGFAGTATLVLGLLGLFLNERIGRGMRWTLFAAALFGWWLTLGEHGSLYPALSGILPGLASLRCPGRFGFLVTFAAAWLGAMGLDGLRRTAADVSQHRLFRRTLLALALLLTGGILTAALLFQEGPGSEIFRFLMPEKPDAGSPPAVAARFYALYFDLFLVSLAQVFAVALVVLGLAAALASFPRIRTGIVMLILALACGEILRFAAAYHSSFPVSNLIWPESVRRLLSADDGRWRFASVRSAADWNQGMVAGARNVWGADPFMRKNYSRALMLSQGMDGNNEWWRQMITIRYSTPYTRLLGMRWLITPSETKAGAEVWRVRLEENGIRVFEDAGALPRGYTVAASRTLAAGEDPVLAVNAADFAPTGTVLLSEPAPSGAAAVETGAGSDAPSPGQVRILRDDPEDFQAAVTMQASGWFVLMDQWLPGWTATVDGKPARIYMANAVGRALPLGPGEHQVEMTYRAPGLAAGAWISALSWIVWTSLLVGNFRWLRRFRRRPSLSAEDQEGAAG